MRTGDQDELKNKGDVLASEPSSSGQAVRTDKEVRESSERELIFVLTVFQKKKSTVTNRKWTTSASKWQNFRMNQKPRARTKTCKRVIF